MVLPLGILVCVLIWSWCINFKLCNSPSMAYFICHGLWLNVMHSIPILENMQCTLVGHGLVIGRNYTLWKSNYVNGGQGGDINALWKELPSSLGIGLLHWFGLFAAWVRELCLYSDWWHEALEVGRDGKCISHFGLASLIWLFILLFKSYSLSWLDFLLQVVGF